MHTPSFPFTALIVSLPGSSGYFCFLHAMVTHQHASSLSLHRPQKEEEAEQTKKRKKVKKNARSFGQPAILISRANVACDVISLKARPPVRALAHSSRTLARPQIKFALTLLDAYAKLAGPLLDPKQPLHDPYLTPGRAALTPCSLGHWHNALELMSWQDKHKLPPPPSPRLSPLPPALPPHPPPLAPAQLLPVVSAHWYSPAVGCRPNPVYTIMVDHFLNLPFPEWYYAELQDSVPASAWDATTGKLSESPCMAHAHTALGDLCVVVGIGGVWGGGGGGRGGGVRHCIR